MKNPACLLFVLVVALKMLAQESREKPPDNLGFFAGASFYLGDLNNFSNFYPLTQPALGLVYRHNFNPRFSLRMNGIYGIVKGDDAVSHSSAQKQRNLSFRSNIIEGSAQLEFNYLEYKIGSEKYPASFYLFLGLGGFWFDPQANLNGSWVKLRPLHTEGKKYSPVQVCMPLGIGAKFNMGTKAGLAIEWGMRKTFTDYLDDVSTVYIDSVILSTTRGSNAEALSDRSTNNPPGSINTGRQRGNSKNKDWYSFVGVAITFKLKEQETPCFHAY